MERFRATDLRVDTKADSTPVTDADRRTEEALRERLRAARPAHAVAGEEFGADGEAEWRWLLDPIDGTKNYARGVPVWATLIALRRNDEGVCGVVSAPALGRRWFAARGDGAWSSSGDRLAVSSVAQLDAASLSCTDVRDFANLGLGEQFHALLRSCRVVRGFGDFWSHMLTAEGAIDVGIEVGTQPWDVAAVQVIVEESGGRFSDLHGARRIDTRSAVTSNGVLHEQVLAMMRRA
ncbi:MAG: histidinol-phosphatase [Candidatus Dormibacteraeota bacterium]|nr:histidinol-phosphatase [Candidatus Dormibacteraeota bacterium]MBV9526567.1 histidinol-phosphatase [Candidatus Dormibacteraeota bacterium]